jgi:hypothetical protein
MRNKHITINPAQTCDICFATVFEKEFYIFPCSHAFHRECVLAYLKSYRAKDPKVNYVIKTIDSCQGQISAIRGMAQYIDATGNPMPGGMTSSMSHKPNDSEMKDSSLLSGIKDMFMAVVQTNTGEINSQTRKMLDKGQQETIRRNLGQIDSVLKKECLFCGPILIDMIDNDIDV